jgi:hypothetical protein
MYATTPSGFVEALATEASPPIEAPASTIRFASAQLWWRTQRSVASIAAAAAAAERANSGSPQQLPKMS